MLEKNMNKLETSFTEERITQLTIDTLLRIGILVALLFWCFHIISPFLYPIIWGIIIAVATYGSYQKLSVRIGNRPVLAAVLVSLILLAVLIVPVVLLTDSMATGINVLAEEAKQGTLKIPPPPEAVAGWPLIGEWLHAIWLKASVNIEAVLKQFAPQLKSMGSWLLAAAAEVGFGVLQFVLSIIIAGLLLANAESSKRSAVSFTTRLAGEKGIKFVEIAAKTVNGVTRGILGVAIIQGVLAGLGFLVAGIPGAGLWAFVAMFLAIIQIGLLPVTIPAILYVFSTAEPVTAIIFLIWNIIISTMDNILKPLLMGKGAVVPIPIIFLGAIGGFIASGILGLFTGAIILSIGYSLYLNWVNEGTVSEVEAADVLEPAETE
jgi:predicted PurR-regulated permease PerM